MYEQQELYELKQVRKLTKQVWTCNCKHDCIGKSLAKMHLTVVDSDNRCTLCGYYALKLEAKVLNAERSVLNTVFGHKRPYDMTNRRKVGPR